MNNTPDDTTRPKLALMLRRAWYGLNQTFRRRIAEDGITPDQFTILRWLTENPDGMTQRSLADAMASDPNTITAILTRMIKAGLVERRTDPDDARCNRIRIRSKGRALHAKLQPIASTLQAELLASIPADERDRFLTHLASVANCLEVLEKHEQKNKDLG